MDVPVLIYAPATLGPSWHYAIRTYVKGFRDPRWKVMAYTGKNKVDILHRDFKPDEWVPLQPTVN
jgi:hypothetical protein